MGWVSRSRPDCQAKLGETNKFYYDEKLKRWVEEGVEPPAQEAALPPPPTTASFQNGMSDHNVNSAFQSQSSPANGGSETKSLILADHHSSGIPPIPPSTNQFSARSRTGVRSRYVDTFNKSGGTPTNLFKSPFVPAAKAGGGAKFFVPTPTATGEQKVDATEEGIPEVTINEDHPSTLSTKDSPFSSPSSSSSSLQTIHRFPSMNNIALVENKGMGALQNGNGSRPYHSRAASWSPDMYNRNEIKTLGETLGMMPPSSFMPSDHSSMRPNSNGGSFGDLHEVEL